MGRGWEVEGRGWEVDGEGLRGGSGSGGGWAGRWRRDQEVEREELGGEGGGVGLHGDQVKGQENILLKTSIPHTGCSHRP